uniref:Apyrase n=1 Tax=Culicoides sonorensis TaxID=179676 RepID=A0A336MT34_CULSO
MYDWRQRLLAPSPSTGYRIGNRTIRFQTQFVWLLIALGFVVLVFFYIKPSSSTKNGSSSYYENNYLGDGETLLSTSMQYNHTYPLSAPIISNGIVNYKIAIIADMDTDSKIQTSKDEWKSYLKRGFLSYNSRQESVSVNWDDEDTMDLTSSYSNKGRGMELSELVVFNGRLLTIDDRTGIVFEIIKDKMIPWVILVDGDGQSPKAFKAEWATVKDEHLIVGSMGKEWTSSTGEFLSYDPMYIKRVSITGEVQHINWTNQYKALRKVTGIDFPGYILHESGMWSNELKKWFFLPRRCSTETYNDKLDEHKGCNILLKADPDFRKVEIVKVGEVKPTLGYSSFKFIPNTNDQVIVALKTEEVDGKTSTYITVFKIDGKILLADQKISSTLKFEGLEFV